MIEQYKPFIEQLLHNEPWRAEEGAADAAPCSGALSYDGTRFWLCACGRVGNLPLVLHRPAGGQLRGFFRRFKQALTPRAAAS